ncbi:MAG: Na(+)-translocating NADH-quinone reductase subunit A [Planctomycetota bacterium]|nr:MAG: Na(+)-translocating NADH-quinone reductase subunit A [Planctomycetota bacterium]
MVMRFQIERGLDVPIEGDPDQQKVDVKHVSRVALLGDDYIGMRPTMLVGVDDEVQLGQPVFSDKKTEGVIYTAPASGRVVAINRGEKRRFLSLVIEKSERQESRDFGASEAARIPALDRQEVVDKLVQSGLWTSLRTRPFSKVPAPATTPHSLFVNAMDTNPLAMRPARWIEENREFFEAGVAAVARLPEHTTYLCRDAEDHAAIPGEDLEGVEVVEFHGPHPAGLVGTHMHFVKPATAERVHWYLNYQDVIAIGRLFVTGQLDLTRMISLAGPSVLQPRLIRTQVGADLAALLQGELEQGEIRVVSGSVLCGRAASGPVGFLGRYHLQVSCLPEGRQREFLGWQMPGFDRFSVTRAFASAWVATRKKFRFTTTTWGSERAMVPIGTYEKVVPLDLLPTLLLRSLISRDTDTAQALGCLELDEEDLGLCTFVCPGKYEYGEILRDNLLTIEKEG